MSGSSPLGSQETVVDHYVEQGLQDRFTKPIRRYHQFRHKLTYHC
ncbi:hypothetical protein HMPREF9579_01568 [Cutibacterium acnes HL087PA1]|nr:hypothetical protein HMPREF9579_01568 [Cutibacterium acnes HL087PA1]